MTFASGLIEQFEKGLGIVQFGGTTGTVSAAQLEPGELDPLPH